MIENLEENKFTKGMAEIELLDKQVPISSPPLPPSLIFFVVRKIK